MSDLYYKCILKRGTISNSVFDLTSYIIDSMCDDIIFKRKVRRHIRSYTAFQNLLYKILKRKYLDNCKLHFLSENRGEYT